RWPRDWSSDVCSSDLSPAPLAPRLPDGTWDRTGPAGPRSRRDVKWYERRLATPAMAVTAATRIATATAPTTKTSTQSPMLSTVKIGRAACRERAEDSE